MIASATPPTARGYSRTAMTTTVGTTAYQYDPANRLSNAGQIGEQVNLAYNNAGLLNSVIGTTPYVSSTTYDAAGRVDLRVLGSNVVQQDYVYFPWTTYKGNGRLQRLKAGVSGNLTSLQDLNYTYDAMGNILTILDNKAGGRADADLPLR